MREEKTKDTLGTVSFWILLVWHLGAAGTAAAKSLQSCLTLCDPIDGSPPGSPVPGILQARTLEWVAISFSNAWKWKAKGKLLSRVRLLATPWTAALQTSPSMGFSRQKYWSRVPLPSPIFLTMRYYIILIIIYIRADVMGGKLPTPIAWKAWTHSHFTVSFFRYRMIQNSKINWKHKL